jgi:hypothetical protein
LSVPDPVGAQAPRYTAMAIAATCRIARSPVIVRHAEGSLLRVAAHHRVGELYRRGTLSRAHRGSPMNYRRREARE